MPHAAAAGFLGGACLSSGCTLQAAAMTPLPAAALADVTNVCQTSSPAANNSPLASVPAPAEGPQGSSTSLAAACGVQVGPSAQASSLVELPDVRPKITAESLRLRLPCKAAPADQLHGMQEAAPPAAKAHEDHREARDSSESPLPLPAAHMTCGKVSPSICT